MNSKVIVATDGVTGNIGSCSVVSTTYPVNAFKNQTIAVNSCTGEEVFSSEEYLTHDALMIVPTILLITGMLWVVFKR